MFRIKTSVHSSRKKTKMIKTTCPRIENQKHKKEPFCHGNPSYPPQSYPPRNKALLRVINHWFPLIKKALLTLITAGVALGRGPARIPLILLPPKIATYLYPVFQLNFIHFPECSDPMSFKSSEVNCRSRSPLMLCSWGRKT